MKSQPFTIIQTPKSVLPERKKPLLEVVDDTSPDKSEDEVKVLNTQIFATPQVEHAKEGNLILPRPIVLLPSRTLTIRYTCSSGATNVAPTPNQILSLFGAITSSSSAAYAVHNRFKVIKITAWPAAGGEVSLAWNSGSQFSTPDEVKVDTLPTGTTISRKLEWVPPANSLAKQWQAASSSTANSPFTYVATSGSIIDVKCELTQSAVLGAVALSSTGMSSGVMYYGYLGSANVSPVGFTYGSLFT